MKEWNLEISNTTVREFWNSHPVAAAAVEAAPGTSEFYQAFDRLREAPECEPFWFSELVHDYAGCSNRRVLDVGCGNGYVLSHYARHGAEVHGIDLTPRAVELSRQRFALTNLPGTFSITDGDHIPYSAGFFDLVCSMGVLHHIADPRPMVNEIHRVLKPGGRVILMLYYRHGWRNLVTYPLLKLLHPKYRGLPLQKIRDMNDGPDCPLALVYSRTEARTLLAGAGFAEINFRINSLCWRELFGKTPLTRWLERRHPDLSGGILARNLGWFLYVFARKPE